MELGMGLSGGSSYAAPGPVRARGVVHRLTSLPPHPGARGSVGLLVGTAVGPPQEMVNLPCPPGDIRSSVVDDVPRWPGYLVWVLCGFPGGLPG